MLKLTDNEFKAVALLCNGYGLKQIGAKLHKTVDTINYRIRTAKKRNDIKTSAEFVAQFVLKYGDPKKIIAHKDFFKNLIVVFFLTLQATSIVDNEKKMLRVRHGARVRTIKVRRLND